jgi:hypothetical protein
MRDCYGEKRESWRRRQERMRTTFVVEAAREGRRKWSEREKRDGCANSTSGFRTEDRIAR